MKIYRKPLLLSIPALLFSIALNVPAQTKFGNDYIWQIAPSDYSTKIIGTWRLVRVEIINSDGRKRPPYGASPIGRIVFDSRSRFTILCIATTDQNDKEPILPYSVRIQSMKLKGR